MIKPSDMDKIILSAKTEFRSSTTANKYDFDEVCNFLYKGDIEDIVEWMYETYPEEDNRDNWKKYYKQICDNFYSWMINKPKRHIFRAIKTRFGNDDMLNYITTKAKKVGVCWAFDIEHAISYFAENENITNDYILEAEIDVFKNVDINYTIYANAFTYYNMKDNNEFECRLIENTPIKLLNIYNMYSETGEYLNLLSVRDIKRYNITRDKLNSKPLNITVRA